MKAAIIGGGVIGGGWAARFVLNGWDVAVFDPADGAQDRVETVLELARRSLPSLYDRALPEPGHLRFVTSVEDAVAGADWVQESVPERLELKHKVLAQIIDAAPAGAVIGSSTSGFKPSELNIDSPRVIVAHPFNPVYLLPLVELVGDPARTEQAAGMLRSVGMYPLTVRAEIDAHIADRLLEAVWRESLWLVKDGIATTEEIDEAIRMGFGLRWAQMGLFETYRIAGGEAGMAHFLGQFGPALKWPWTKLMDVPELTDDLVQTIADQSDAQSGAQSIRALERKRDDNLVGILRALKISGAGAGEVLLQHEETLARPSAAALPITVARAVPQSWTDYNGHMSEMHYLEVGGMATDRMLQLVGSDAAYVAGGQSFFTVETHIRHLAELSAGDQIEVTTQVLAGGGKKLHLFHRIARGGDLAATVESLLVHVDLATRRSSVPSDAVAALAGNYAAQHAEMPLPEGAGRFVGQKVGA